jgi:hypothetical protein
MIISGGHYGGGVLCVNEDSYNTKNISSSYINKQQKSIKWNWFKRSKSFAFTCFGHYWLPREERNYFTHTVV